MSSESDGGDWAAPGSTTPPPGWSTEQPPPAPTSSWGQQWYAAPAAAQPGIVPLRPLGVGELLDGSFAAIRRYPRATLGLSGAVMFIVTVVQVLSQWWLLSGIEPPAPSQDLSQATDYFSRVGTAGAIGFVIGVLATLLLTGLVTAVIGEAVLGRAVAPRQAWQRLRPVFGRLVGTTLLTFLVVAVAVVVPALPGVALLLSGSDAAGGGLLALGLVAGLLLAAWLYVSLAFAPAAVVLEKQPVVAALRRSRALVRGSWWRVFGILLLTAVIAAVVSAIVALPFGLAGGGLASIGSRTTGVGFGQLVVAGIGSLVANTLVRPFTAGVAALLYIDRRMRAEALDVALTQAASTSG